MPIYSPEIFDVKSMEHARFVILTPEGNQDTNTRWERETPYIINQIDQVTDLNSSSVVLDYGCGIGRVSKALIEKYECAVIGVDISAGMRSFAETYVNDPRILCCSPEMFKYLIYDVNLKVDFAISIWALQHCINATSCILRMRRSLVDSGKLFIINNFNRCIPTQDDGFIHDGLDVHQEIIKNGFTDLSRHRLPIELFPEQLVMAAYEAVYKKVES